MAEKKLIHKIKQNNGKKIYENISIFFILKHFVDNYHKHVSLYKLLCKH